MFCFALILIHKINIYNILIKNCSTKAGFDGQSYIRIAIRNQKENDLLIEALLQLK